MEKYKKKITKLNDSPKFQAMMSYEERERLEHNTEKRLAYEDGVATGITQGEKQNKITIAKEMLLKGFDISLIMEITKLSNEEVERLKEI